MCQNIFKHYFLYYYYYLIQNIRNFFRYFVFGRYFELHVQGTTKFPNIWVGKLRVPVKCMWPIAYSVCTN